MGSTFADLRGVDVLDILIVAGLFWVGIAWVREARARVALGGIAAIAILFWLARWLDLRLTTSLLQGFMALAALVLVVVFQDDLRRLFEGITAWVRGTGTRRPSGDILDELGALCFSLARRRVGALFVLPGRESVDRLLEGGQYLDGRVSEPLLWSLLDPKTPGHDGAIVIRAGRVSRFGVHLPLSTDWDEIGAGGTRHAAALGLAERSDAFCIAVSEERGEVSVAWRGGLERLPNAAVLRERIDRFLRRTARKRREPWLASRLATARHHWREGLLAGALASGLWLHTVPGASLDRSAKAIPIVIDNVPEGYRVADIEPAEIEVVFEGRRRDLALARGDLFQVRLDGDLVEDGRRTFSIRENQVDHPPELRVVGIDPGQVRLRVESF
ncbi:MAG: DNA integrity scanning protein DisA nucleotide-binding domain protein [Deltaproteobacteria bacterium]|nr:DNA integrity scanning protein DisA nucleotide-binding domain protein [Deltaproteobacteria bacterium]